ncbi:MAG: GerMN domain-containing protein [Acidimicrobiales bacterium]
MIRRPSMLLAAVFSLSVAVLGGCGLSANGEPQAIAPNNVPPDLLDPNPRPSTTLPESAGTTSVDVYFLATDGARERLSPVRREVTDLTMPGERLTALFTQPSEEEITAGLTTSIPADTTLIRAAVTGVDGTEAVVELSDDLFSIRGEQLARAFAQIVWTVTEPDGGIRSVRFVVDGVEIRAPDARGNPLEEAVTRADYAALSPPQPP